MARLDPYRNFKFRVIIDGFAVAGFTRVGPLAQETEVIKYREGGDNSSTRKLIGQTDFSPIVLERGLSADVDFCLWAAAVHNVVGDFVPEYLVKQSIMIQLLDKTGRVKKTWSAYRCWVSRYETSELNALGNEVVIERITLQNEGILLEP